MKIVYIVLAMSCDITHTYLTFLFKPFDFFTTTNIWYSMIFKTLLQTWISVLYRIAFTNIQFYIIQDTLEQQFVGHAKTYCFPYSSAKRGE